MSIGAAYFGNRIPRHAAADMEDLAARGFTGVLHTFSENDLLGDAHRLSSQIWIQGFGLGPEDLDDVRHAVQAAREAGVDELSTWGYEACGHMDALGTIEPKTVWAALSAALTARS